MRWVSPSATPTTKIAAPTTDVAIRGGLGLSSGSGIGSGSAAAWDAESDQDSPVDPRKVGDLCSLFQYLCKKQCVVISWIRRPTGASSHIVSCRAVSCYILPYADMPSVVMCCHVLSHPDRPCPVFLCVIEVISEGGCRSASARFRRSRLHVPRRRLRTGSQFRFELF